MSAGNTGHVTKNSLKEKIKKMIPDFFMRKYYESRAKKNYYGQDGEDVLLQNFINPYYIGFYVDIGAYHPALLSNTKWFYERGWHGINIDANPVSIKNFQKKRKRDINILSGVSDIEGEMNYYYWGDYSSMNTFNEELYKSWNDAGMKLKEIKKVKVQTINKILEENLPNGQKIDFVSLDVEGFEMKILNTFNFEKHAPDYFLVEDIDYASENMDFMDFINNPLYKFMKNKGYVVVAKTRLTILFKRCKQ